MCSRQLGGLLGVDIYVLCASRFVATVCHVFHNYKLQTGTLDTADIKFVIMEHGKTNCTLSRKKNKLKLELSRTHTLCANITSDLYPDLHLNMICNVGGGGGGGGGGGLDDHCA